MWCEYDSTYVYRTIVYTVRPESTSGERTMLSSHAENILTTIAPPRTFKQTTNVRGPPGVSLYQVKPSNVNRHDVAGESCSRSQSYGALPRPPTWPQSTSSYMVPMLGLPAPAPPSRRTGTKFRDTLNSFVLTIVHSRFTPLHAARAQCQILKHCLYQQRRIRTTVRAGRLSSSICSGHSPSSESGENRAYDSFQGKFASLG